MIDVKVLDDCIKYLEKTHDIECNPYPDYSKEIYDALNILDTDVDYISNISKIENKDIESMNIDDIRTMLTFIARGERFCDGHIAEFVCNGILFKLMVRLKELIS